jgi:hypothetical protein
MKNGTEKYRETHTHTTSAMEAPSMGGRTSGTFEPYKDTPRSPLQQTHERHNAINQNTLPGVVPPAEAVNRPASIGSQPRPLYPGTDVHTENGNLALDAATPTAPTAVHNETFTRTGSAVDISESRDPVNSCDDFKQEPDYQKIVLKLHDLKRERQMLEQKIEAGHNNLPDVSILTQTANEAQRVADEAQRAAEAATKAVKDAQAKQSELAAHDLSLKELIQEYHGLRAELNIDWIPVSL